MGVYTTYMSKIMQATIPNVSIHTCALLLKSQ